MIKVKTKFVIYDSERSLKTLVEDKLCDAYIVYVNDEKKKICEIDKY